MEALKTPSSPGLNPRSVTTTSKRSVEQRHGSFDTAPSDNHGRGHLDRQRSPSNRDYNTESIDHVEDAITPRTPLRSSTVPNLSRYKAANRMRYDEDDRILQRPARQSTGDTKNSATFDETAPWDRKNILALDGGGIRGYSALLILQELMIHIKTLEMTFQHDSAGPVDPAASSYHPLSPTQTITTDLVSFSSSSRATQGTGATHWLPCHYFDYIAGISTGGLIGIMLGRLRMNIDDCISDYEKLGVKVFGRKRMCHVRSPLWWPRDKYSHEALENVVKEVVKERVPKVPQFPGGHNFAFDENRCKTVVVSYQQQDDEDAEKKGVETPYLFRTYKNYHRSDNAKERRTDRNLGPAHDIPIWEVARATSAAPGYFKPPIIQGKKYLDGGVGANNPCGEIYEEVRRMNNHAEKCASIILSIGTGKDTGWRQFKEGSALQQYINFINVARKMATQSEDTHVSMLLRVRDAPVNYLRLNVEEGIGPMKLDEWQARGPIRMKLGARIGKIRSSRSKKQTKAGEQSRGSNGHVGIGERDIELATSNHLEAPGQNGHAIGAPRPAKSIPSTTCQDSPSSIPQWFQPKNKTLDFIRQHTREYLNDPDVQQEIHDIAIELVKGRRARAADEQRWEKVCFGTWYQCKVRYCPKGEYDYGLRRSMQKHLLDKHRDAYNKEDMEDLNKMLDECKIRIH